MPKSKKPPTSPPEAIKTTFAELVNKPAPLQRAPQQFFARKPVVVPSVHAITGDIIATVAIEIERLLIKAKTDGLDRYESEQLLKYTRVIEMATAQSEQAQRGVLPGIGKGVEELSDTELKKLLGF